MKILVTGGTGMVGSVFNNIKTDHELILVSSKDCDLKNSLETNRMIKTIKPQAVIHLAARVGGIKGNRDHMGDFFSDNMAIKIKYTWARLMKVILDMHMQNECWIFIQRL